MDEQNPKEVADNITSDLGIDEEPDPEEDQDIIAPEEEGVSKLTLRFPDDEIKSEFVAWMTDAGGEQDFFQFLNISTVDLDNKDFILKFPWS